MSFDDFKMKAKKFKPKAVWVVHIGGHIAFYIEKIAFYIEKVAFYIRKESFLYRKTCKIHSSLKNSKKLFTQILSLPLYPQISKQDLDYVISTIREV